MSKSGKVVLRVDNNVTYIDGKLDSNIYQKLKKCLGYTPEDSFWRIKKNQEDHPNEAWRQKWDGLVTTVCWNQSKCRCFNKKRGPHFHSGLISKARNFFSENDVDYQVEDIRQKSNEKVIYRLSNELESRDYQEEVVQKCLNVDRGVIKMSTGSGKTSIASAIIANRGKIPVIFYVISVDLLNQAKSELERFVKQNDLAIEVGMVGGGKKEIKDITVMTIQTAVRSLGGKYVKFDDEEISKENTNIDDIKKDIDNLIRSAKLMIADECLDGNTLIETEKGIIPISNVSKLNCKYVLSHNGNEEIWKKIIAFMPKGEKKVLKITLKSGEKIRCTPNHLFMTQRGWVKSEDLFIGEEVFICEQKKNGDENIEALSQKPHCVNVDVAKKLSQKGHFLNRSLSMGEIRDIANIFMDTISVLKIGMLHYLDMKNKQYLERCWEIRVYLSLILEALIQDYLATTVPSKSYGYNTKQVKYLFYLLNYINLLTMDGGKNLYIYEHLVILVLRRFIQFVILTKRNKLVRNGLIISEMSAWRGGYVMTDLEEEIISDYIRKDFRNKKLKLFSYGWKENLEKLVCLRIKEGITSFRCEKTLYEKYYQRLENISQNVCNTNLGTVLSVEEDGFANVFDIEVEDTHCFFANGILVHNCQFWAAETCQIISDSSSKCQYRYSFSATPYRDKGDDILIEGCFGKTIADINASLLIRKGYLVRPTIYFCPISNMRGIKKTSYPNVYKYAIVENEFRNERIRVIAEGLREQGRNVLILCKQIMHGKMLEQIISDTIFLHGAHSGKKRKAHLDKIREGGPNITIASTIFDQGIDVRPLDALILAGSGKSVTRPLQRIGRTLRPYPGKKDAVVVDFTDRCKYLQGHSKCRRNIYETEEEFLIRDIKLGQIG